jgi:spore germination protein GerM
MLRASVIACGLMALVAGCGVRSTSSAATATGDEVPYGLLDERPATTTTVAGADTEVVQIWLTSDDRIVRVDRTVRPPLTLEHIVQVLVEGPTPDESAFGVRSALDESSVTAVDVVAGLATFHLGDSFTAATPRAQLLALAQLVYTATAQVGIDAVSFELGEQPINVPRADGSIADGTVGRRDYADLV